MTQEDSKKNYDKITIQSLWSVDIIIAKIKVEYYTMIIDQLLTF